MIRTRTMLQMYFEPKYVMATAVLKALEPLAAHGLMSCGLESPAFPQLRNLLGGGFGSSPGAAGDGCGGDEMGLRRSRGKDEIETRVRCFPSLEIVLSE